MMLSNNTTTTPKDAYGYDAIATCCNNNKVATN